MGWGGSLLPAAARSGAVIPKASVEFRNQDTGIRRQTTTNGNGAYHIVGIDPGKYDATVQANGFKTLTRENITFQVGDKAQIDFKMQVGSSDQTVSVDGSGLQINTTDASVGTVVAPELVRNLPLNGRSFQDLISMTPGVLTTSPQLAAQSPGKNGDFSINGQRTESNYYVVDGVSANTGTGTGLGGTEPGQSGVVPAVSALGTTQNLLSVDALEEFRVQSSTYSAEYGRSPGGQINLVSRSGTNQFHGTAFDYLRNGYFDANDWFNDNVGQKKLSLHQNDFGGTVGGPFWLPKLYKGTDKTFFFGSYEGLRLTQPVAAAISYVPDIYMRQQAPSQLQAILNAYPQQSPTGIDYGTAQKPSLAQFFQAYGVPGSIDSTSIRLDHTLSSHLSSFFRFSDTQSSLQSRALSSVATSEINSRTYTFGSTYARSTHLTDQFRLGYVSGNSSNNSHIDGFGGAVATNLGAAMGITSSNGQPLSAVFISGIGLARLSTNSSANTGTQWNVTNSLALSYKSHQLTVGIDYRRIATEIIQPTFYSTAEWTSAAQVASNTTQLAYIEKFLNANPIYNETAIFAQDEWKVSHSVNLSLGLRWELNPPPYSGSSVKPYVALGNVAEPSSLTLSSPGASLWRTSWFNFAPRLGLAWQAHDSQGMQTVVRLGGGVFFDTDNEAGLEAFQGAGYSSINQYGKIALPFTLAQQNFSVTVNPPYSTVFAYPNRLQLPYTLAWSAAVEQGLGRSQTLTLSYVASAGRRLIQSQEISAPNPDFQTVFYVPGGGVTSNYQSLQAKFQRQVTRGLNVLGSYTWSHAFDYGSNYTALPLTRGQSDFDVRNNFQAGFSWTLPQPQLRQWANALVGGWGVDGRVLARSSYPITLQGNLATDPVTGSFYYTNVNIVPNQPLYLYGSQYPGGRILNKLAFQAPTGVDPGNAPRNFVRGFSAGQLNFALRRQFVLTDRVGLQFRAEAFNILNHPNFGYVDPTLTDATFGYATKMLNQSLGTVASQYQQGGPRSMQFALKVLF